MSDILFNFSRAGLPIPKKSDTPHKCNIPTFFVMLFDLKFWKKCSCRYRYFIQDAAWELLTLLGFPKRAPKSQKLSENLLFIIDRRRNSNINTYLALRSSCVTFTFLTCTHHMFHFSSSFRRTLLRQNRWKAQFLRVVALIYLSVVLTATKIPSDQNLKVRKVIYTKVLLLISSVKSYTTKNVGIS